MFTNFKIPNLYRGITKYKLFLITLKWKTITVYLQSKHTTKKIVVLPLHFIVNGDLMSNLPRFNNSTIHKL
jgi:hypothetical protein